MKLVHAADLHLGLRAYQRLLPNGTNVREADVARAFQQLITRVIEIAPDLFVIAGDIFHTPRPPNNAIVHAHRQLVQLRQALPDCVVVIVAGNHDAGRTADTGDILALFEGLGVHVASSRAKRIDVPDLDLSVLAVPDVVGVRPALEPDPARRVNVLVLHGEAEYVNPGFTAAPWDYIALGHYHVHRKVADRTYYSGSIEFTSSNPWGELQEGQPKGFVLADLDARTEQLVPLAGVRGFVDLPAIAAAGLAPADIDEQLRAAVDAVPGGIDGKVVRIVIRDIDRTVQAALDMKALRSYRARALNFLTTFRRPEPVAAAPGEPAPRSRLKPLDEIVREAMERRAAAGDIDGAALTALAMGYLEQAGAKEEASIAPATDEQSEVAA